MEEERLRIAGIIGSLRAASWNRRLMDAARELALPDMVIEVAPIGGLPLYNADLDTDGRRPAEVDAFKTAIGSADGVLIASPEYNHSVPGVLQNAIDWASRPGGRSVFVGKPVAIMGASMGLVGTARMQQILKLTLNSMLANTLPHPGVVIGRAQDKFDAGGRLSDEPTRQFLATFLAQFRDFVLRLRPATAARA